MASGPCNPIAAAVQGPATPPGASVSRPPSERHDSRRSTMTTADDRPAGRSSSSWAVPSATSARPRRRARRHRRPARSLPRPGRARSDRRRDAGAHTGTVERNVREWLSAQAAAGLRDLRRPRRPRRRPVVAVSRAARGVHRRDQPGVRGRRVRGRARRGQVGGRGRRGVPARARLRVARARRRALPGDRALLPARVRRLAGRRVAAGPDGTVERSRAGRGSPTSAAATARRRS